MSNANAEPPVLSHDFQSHLWCHVTWARERQRKKKQGPDSKRDLSALKFRHMVAGPSHTFYQKVL